MNDVPQMVASPGELDGVEGWLRVFCLFLTFIIPLVFLGSTVINIGNVTELNESFSQLRIRLIIDTFIRIFIMFFSVYTGVGLLRRRKNAVTVARRFLIVFALSQFLMGLLLHFVKMPEGFSRFVFPGGGFGSAEKGAMDWVIFSISWYVYLNKSRRVRITYNLPGKTLQKTSLWDYIPGKTLRKTSLWDYIKVR